MTQRAQVTVRVREQQYKQQQLTGVAWCAGGPPQPPLAVCKCQLASPTCGAQPPEHIALPWSNNAPKAWRAPHAPHRAAL